MTGTGKDPTTCRNTPEQRQYQLLYQRARGRAVTELIARHKAEYDHLFSLYRGEVQAEAEQIDQAAKQQADHDHGDEPARLKTGRRAKGQKPVDRIDVARCPHCIRHHDRGHVCTVCGAAPGASLSDSRNKNRVTNLPPSRQAATVDPAALAEFNAGTQRAREAARR